MSGQILEGINVVEFAAYAAGPGVGKHLADFGAAVVHIESPTAPDGFRSHYPPFADNKPGINRSGTFALVNSNKLGVTLDLKSPLAKDIVRRIALWADVVIENMTPGTANKLQIDYDSLRQIRPDIIMLSTCNQGQTGPHASHPGFGSHLTSLGGFTNITGYADGPPNILFGPYIDFIGAGFGFIAIVSALEYRRRTGNGQHIDNAQYENGLQYIAGALLDFSSNGRVASRMGNRSPYAAPHGAYPCLGKDQWCVLSVSTNGEWDRLCQVIGLPELANDQRFADLLARKQNEDELDRIIGEWTVNLGVHEVVEQLQSSGLKSAPVNRMEDLFSDSQLLHRRFWKALDHPEIGRHHYENSPFKVSMTPSHIDRPAPLLGEHNDYFYKTLLDLPAEEYDSLVADEVIG